MASRPVFVPTSQSPFVSTQNIEFEWVKGMVKAQVRKRALSLHSFAANHGLENLLEISTASNTEFGVSLSAFNLQVTINLGSEEQPNLHTNSVEAFYQSAKVGLNSQHQKVGPHPEWLTLGSSEKVKAAIKATNISEINLFKYGENVWPAQPIESFFTWLYIQGLMQKEGTLEQLAKFNGFTDIYFNPKKTINCQARASAMAVSLFNSGQLETVMKTRKSFLLFCKANPSGHVGNEISKKSKK